MNPTKVVGCRKIPRTPEEFHKLGARLDSELSVVRPFTRKHGFVFKARTWMNWQDGNRSGLLRSIYSAINERAGSAVESLFAAK